MADTVDVTDFETLTIAIAAVQRNLDEGVQRRTATLADDLERLQKQSTLAGDAQKEAREAARSATQAQEHGHRHRR